jgi:hypothetical protein
MRTERENQAARMRSNFELCRQAEKEIQGIEMDTGIKLRELKAADAEDKARRDKEANELKKKQVLEGTFDGDVGPSAHDTEEHLKTPAQREMERLDKKRMHQARKAMRREEQIREIRAVLEQGTEVVKYDFGRDQRRSRWMRIVKDRAVAKRTGGSGWVLEWGDQFPKIKMTSTVELRSAKCIVFGAKSSNFQVAVNAKMLTEPAWQCFSCELTTS